MLTIPLYQLYSRLFLCNGAVFFILGLSAAREESSNRVRRKRRPFGTMKVRYNKVTLAGSALADVGGWQALEGVPSWQQVSAYVDSAGNIDVRAAKRFTIEK